DALVLRGVRVGAGDEHPTVGRTGAAGPHLLAVDDPLVAVAHGPGLQAGEVGAGARLAEQLAPRLAAGGEGQQPAVALLLRAVLDHDGTAHVLSQPARRAEGAGVGDLLGDDAAVGRAQATSAVADRPGREGPPLTGQPGPPL